MLCKCYISSLVYESSGFTPPAKGPSLIPDPIPTHSLVFSSRAGPPEERMLSGAGLHGQGQVSENE